MTTTKYLLLWRVRSIEESWETVRGWKDAEGNPQFEKKHVGWLTVFDPHGISILMVEKPAWRKGQKVTVSLETTDARDLAIDLHSEG